MTPVWAKRFFIPKSPRDVKTHSKPCPPSLFKSFFAPNRAYGPEVPPLAGLRGKSIGGERIPSGDPPWLPQNGAGRSGARPGAPTSETPLLGERTACPPDPRNDLCLMIFPRNALASGRARLGIPSPFTPTWRKVKVGKPFESSSELVGTTGRPAGRSSGQTGPKAGFSSGNL